MERSRSVARCMALALLMAALPWGTLRAAGESELRNWFGTRSAPQAKP